MPNHVNNHLRARGTQEELKAFDTQFKSKPQPVHFPVYVEKDGKFHTKENTENFEAIAEAHYQERLKNAKKEYSYSAFAQPHQGILEGARELSEGAKLNVKDLWYAWNVKNWGTKWDIYEMQADLDFEEEKNGEFTNIYSWCSAWSPPLEVIKKMSEVFPELTFTLLAIEEDCYEFYFRFKGGELQQEFTYATRGTWIANFLEDESRFEEWDEETEELEPNPALWEQAVEDLREKIAQGVTF